MADDNGAFSAVESLLGDRYTREARLAPAFLSVFPILLLLIATFPDLQKAIPALLSLLCVFGLVRWISHIARGIGDEKEIVLFRKWGGKPTTTMLRFVAKRPDNPCAPSADHIRHLLGEAPPEEDIRRQIAKRKGPKLPRQIVDEAANQIVDNDRRADKLDSIYEPVVAWMRENSRDSDLVMEEEISYGFQRNFFALRKFALACGALALLVQAAEMYVERQKTWPFITSIPVAVLVAIVFYIIGVRLFVTETSVMVQGFIYARQLLDSFCGAASSGKAAKKTAPAKPG
jgi:hypothetical protein